MDLDQAWSALQFVGYVGWPSALVVSVAIVLLRWLDAKAAPSPKPLGSFVLIFLGLILGVISVLIGLLPNVFGFRGDVSSLLSPLLSMVFFVFLARNAKHRYSGVALAFWFTFCGFICAESIWLIHWDETGQSGVGIVMFICGATGVVLLLGARAVLEASAAKRAVSLPGNCGGKKTGGAGC
ncbi:hypothetical protein WG915_11435 [Corynebacterium sp. H128]|uniref:hypothetical protein n=1 Tax=Corynebacterium sp. H128 TaxID=3133427 RepID=UPI0030A7B715